MPKYNGNRALCILAENWDSGDSWGSTLDALGACCDFLAIKGEGWRIPDDAGYVPAGLPTSEELLTADIFTDESDELYSSTLYSLSSAYWNIGMVDDWVPFDLGDLEQAAILLTRLANVLKSMDKEN